ncbi:unnamed protein product [Rhizophagus irregularis]|nr:unnamed protein product [Rhizophagus irregularis]
MPKNLWKILDYEKYEDYVTFPSIDEQETDERVVYMDDLEKRKQAGDYGIFYSAEWSKGYINSWDIENQEWKRCEMKVTLQRFDNSSDSSGVNIDLLNEIKLQIPTLDVIRCFGLTQDLETHDHMMNHCFFDLFADVVRQIKTSIRCIRIML